MDDGAIAPQSEAAEERAIEYGCPAHYKLSVADGSSAPFHRFEVFVDQDGAGHLQSRPLNDPKHPRPMPAAASPAGQIKDWDARISFLDEKRGWTKLTLSDAKTIWREGPSQGEFSTFNANNTHHGEENIFHLDLLCDDSGLLKAYRVRGIGVKVPEWVGPSGRLETPPKVKPPDYSQPDMGCLPHMGPAYVLKDAQGVARFDLYVDAASTGQLSVHEWKKAKLPRWPEKSFFVEHLPDGSTMASVLNFSTALKFWGSPRAHEEKFSTFDVQTDFAGRPEIFHLDFEFGGGLLFTAYRVRGNGISNPQWVKRHMPAGPDAWRIPGS